MNEFTHIYVNSGKTFKIHVMSDRQNLMGVISLFHNDHNGDINAWKWNNYISYLLFFIESLIDQEVRYDLEMAI